MYNKCTYLSIGDELILFWTFRKNGKIDRWADFSSLEKADVIATTFFTILSSFVHRPITTLNNIADEFDIQLFDVWFFSLKEVFQVSKEGPTS